MDQQQEHRLQRVEEVVSDIRTDVAGVKADVRHGFEQMSAKLDALIELNLPPRVTALEVTSAANEAAKSNRKKFLAKVFAGVATAAVVALGGLGGHFLFGIGGK